MTDGRRLRLYYAAARLAARAALRLSLATSEGHVCLPLQALRDAAELDGDTATLRSQLLASGVVGTTGIGVPMTK